MKAFFESMWETLRASYWFVPSLMAGIAIGLSYGLLALDQHLNIPGPSGVAWLYSGGAAGARSVLSTIASSVITVAGTTFSITIAALSLASSQFGPRLLRGFLRDTGNQMVLGTFIGTFVYCLLILRTIRGVEHDVFVPNLAVTGGVMLSLASVAVLIYFINHVSNSIQVAQVISSVAAETMDAIERLYPSQIGIENDNSAGDSRETLPSEKHGIPASKSGYVQIVDRESLIELARTGEGVLEIKHRPGTFVTTGSILAVFWSSAEISHGFREKVNDAFVLGPHRTMTQDTRFGFDQLVEVAVRALSPGINDPFTAMMCMDRLGEALVHLAGRHAPSAERRDSHGVLRVIAETANFSEMSDAAFDPIRRAGRASFAVMAHLMKILEIVGDQVTVENRIALRHQADLIHAERDALPGAEERRLLALHYSLTTRILESPNDFKLETNVIL